MTTGIQFASNVSGIPCIIEIESWERHRPAFIAGPPERCYDAEGGCGEWTVLDRHGRPALWLSHKLTAADEGRIDDECFAQMESAE